MCGFLVKVEVRECENPSKGLGVFALECIPQGTLVWSPDTLNSWTSTEAKEELEKLAALKGFHAAQTFLRHSFVVSAFPELLQHNEGDDGKFTNHSSRPNVGSWDCRDVGSIALRQIERGDELTCDYKRYGPPPSWYLEICARYFVMPTSEVAAMYED